MWELQHPCSSPAALTAGFLSMSREAVKPSCGGQALADRAACTFLFSARSCRRGAASAGPPALGDKSAVMEVAWPRQEAAGPGPEPRSNPACHSAGKHVVISAKTVIRLLGTNLSQKAEEEEGRNSNQPFYMKLYREKWRPWQDGSVVGSQLICALPPLLSLTFPRVPAPFRPDPPKGSWVQHAPCLQPALRSIRGAGARPAVGSVPVRAGAGARFPSAPR